MPGAAPVRVDVAGRTDVGRTREHNEDAFLVADLSAGLRLSEEGVHGYAVAGRELLFMVADGMGGAAAGEIASAMAVETVFRESLERWRASGEHDPAAFARALRQAAEEANQRIHVRAAEDPELRGMGTTATIAGLLGDSLYLAQVGDSRAYLVRDGHALQITKDQSLLQRLIDAGDMTEEEAERSGRRNIILQALGPDARVTIDLTHQEIRRGDVLILCSDGLSGLVRGETIARLVAEYPDVRDLCERLIDEANESGGPDNITVIAARFEGDGLRAAQIGDPVGHQRFVGDDDAAPRSDDDWINRDPTLPPPPLTLDASPPAAIPRAAEPLAAGPPLPSAAELERRHARGRLWMRVLAALAAVLVVVAVWRVFLAP